MKNEKETRKNLLASAKAEFLEKGFMQASLRNICKNANVTTGALYFFFKDKEDLFAALVESPINMAYEMMIQHYQSEVELIKQGTLKKDDFAEDGAMAGQIIHMMYQHLDEFQLALTKSQGSRYENCVDRFVDITEQHYRMLADAISAQMGMEKIDDYTLHWISHMHIDTFVHMLTHERNEQTAIRHMQVSVRYFIAGWYGMFVKEQS